MSDYRQRLAPEAGKKKSDEAHASPFPCFTESYGLAARARGLLVRPSTNRGAARDS